MSFRPVGKIWIYECFIFSLASLRFTTKDKNVEKEFPNKVIAMMSAFDVFNYIFSNRLGNFGQQRTTSLHSSLLTFTGYSIIEDLVLPSWMSFSFNLKWDMSFTVEHQAQCWYYCCTLYTINKLWLCTVLDFLQMSTCDCDMISLSLLWADPKLYDYMSSEVKCIEWLNLNYFNELSVLMIVGYIKAIRPFSMPWGQLKVGFVSTCGHCGRN